MPSYLIYDIETIPETEIAHLWVPTAKELLDASSRGVDAFPPLWAHKIISIGMIILDSKLKCRHLKIAGKLYSEEKDRIKVWSNLASGKLFQEDEPCSLVDVNGRSFDMPVIQYRAFHYGIQLPWYFGKMADNYGKISSFSKSYRDRYAEKHLDLLELFSNFGAFSRPQLRHLACLMGLPGKLDGDGTTVYENYKKGLHADIDIYCMEDVIQSAFIFMRYRYLAGLLDLDTYREVVKDLFDYISSIPTYNRLISAINTDLLYLAGS